MKPRPYSFHPAHRMLALGVILAVILTACSNLPLPLPPMQDSGESVQVPSASPPAESFPGTDSSPAEAEDQAPEGESTAELVEVIFRVFLPKNALVGETVYLSVVDEVTGLAFNPDLYPMELDDLASPEHPGVYRLALNVPIGSVVKYRYERQLGNIRALEHTADGSPVRYRMYLAQGAGVVEDVVSRWTDTAFDGPTGRILGTATDASTGEPIPNLLVAAGGAQTFSAADGAFVIEGLPPGIHNLVGYAIDGAYQTFQQGAQIASDSSTPAGIALTPAEFTDVTFTVSVPEGTPPLIPIRLAGNLYQLGNTFGDLAGGMSGLAARMPVMQPGADGRYSLTLSLPVGADIRYKYTVGDGFWNAEHRSDGDFRLRQLLVGADQAPVEEAIETWYSGDPTYLSFEITTPANTPAGDIVSIQFSPLFGWMQSFPMWSFGDGRWAYLLFSPLNLPGGVSYRYCRNEQCGKADDLATPGESSPGRPIDLSTLPKQVKESVESWVGLEVDLATIPAPGAPVPPRGEAFIAGVELDADFHPSWAARRENTLDEVQGLNANWMIFSPTWSFVDDDPPTLEVVAGQDALWPDIRDVTEQARQRGFGTALFPTVRFPEQAETWWQEAPRDFSWWVTWFDRYRTYILHQADLAAKSEVPLLVLGGDWLAPALPGGVVADGTPSGVPPDAAERWRTLIGEVRQRYSGQLAWALPFGEQEAQAGLTAPPFMDAVDQVYLLWSAPLAAQAGASPEGLVFNAGLMLDTAVLPMQTALQKPVIVAAALPSTDMQEQYHAYNALLSAAASRAWVSGFVSRGYYPPAALQDETISVHGKPAQVVLTHWFGGLRLPMPAAAATP